MILNGEPHLAMIVEALNRGQRHGVHGVGTNQFLDVEHIPVVCHSRGHDEAAWHWSSSFAVFLYGHSHQLRKQRLGKVTYLWMLSHLRRERAPISDNTQRFALCLSFHQTTQFIESLGTCLKSHAQLSRWDLPLCSHAPPDLAHERFYLASG